MPYQSAINFAHLIALQYRPENYVKLHMLTQQLLQSGVQFFGLCQKASDLVPKPGNAKVLLPWDTQLFPLITPSRWMLGPYQT